VADFSLPGRGDDPRRAAMRASNAERDQVVAQLQQHFVEGRLDHEELTTRIDQVWSSQTHGELQRVLSDLPAAPGVPSQPAPAPRGSGRRRRRKGVLGGLRARTGLSTFQLILLAIAAIIVVSIVSRVLRALAPIIVIAVIVWLIMRNRASRT
jgi:Domain of unknown function (DUF1707)